ncbi:hypothetical protein AWZ03_014791 [Drosophila navojoa]|uniref:Uncharacterized protein n=1 Tax=Drosophila navojoa TaxID=7232 RepID=A0A484APP7_DRONA|nr:hypothetical protein AWZ03_014791 [Drosophila navojoa]
MTTTATTTAATAAAAVSGKLQSNVIIMGIISPRGGNKQSSNCFNITHTPRPTDGSQPRQSPPIDLRPRLDIGHKGSKKVN